MKWIYFRMQLAGALCLSPLLSIESTWAFEVDSFYQRHQDVKDASDIINAEVNRRIKNALKFTKSCNLEHLYTNVRNQINADSSGFKIIGGIENWAEKSPSVDRISQPPLERSVYYGTSFDSIFSVGFWLHIYGTAIEKLKKGATQAKNAIARLFGDNDDPLKGCGSQFINPPSGRKRLGWPTVPSEFPPGGMGFFGDLPPGGIGGSAGPPPGGMGGFGAPPAQGDLNFGGIPQETNSSESQPKEPTQRKMTKEEVRQMMRKIRKRRKKLEASMSEQNKRMLAEILQNRRGVLGADMITNCEAATLHFQPKQGTSSLQPLVKMDETLVGVDKFGHFFNEGASYFQKVYKIENDQVVPRTGGLQEALQYGNRLEEGFFGLKTTGIKSYGDLAANYAGLLFWKGLASGSDPLVKCEGGQFKMKKDFDFADYITEAWDEAVNCSEYADSETQQRVESNLASLGVSCPIDVKKCEELGAQYSAEILDAILSSDCRAAASPGRGSERVQPASSPKRSVQ